MRDEVNLQDEKKARRETRTEKKLNVLYFSVQMYTVDKSMTSHHVTNYCIGFVYQHMYHMYMNELEMLLWQ